MDRRRSKSGPRAEEDSMARNETIITDSSTETGLGPLAWIEDIESPEEVLPGWVLAKIDSAVERHGRCWTDEQTATFRHQMAWTLATHPEMRRLVQIVDEGKRRAPIAGTR